MAVWLILSVLTGVFFGIQSVVLKILSSRFEQEQILMYLFFIAGAMLFPAIFIAPHPLNTGPFMVAFTVSLVLNTVAYRLLLNAIANYPVSIVMPFVGLTPLFLTLTSFLILGEAITRFKLMGIVLIVLGGFILQLPAEISWKNVKSSPLVKLINFRERGIYLMVLVAFIWSITASVEKIAVRSSSPEFYGAFIHLGLGGMFWLQQKRKNARHQFHGASGSLLLIALGLISGALAWCQLTAIKMTLVSYVIAFKRAGVLVSTLLGFLILKERNYVKSLSGTLLIILGATIISL